jgi:hypothetical protein
MKAAPGREPYQRKRVFFDLGEGEKIAMLHSDVRARAGFCPICIEGGERPWRVRASFPSGKTIDIGEFNAEAAALEWIALKSAEWLELLKCERNLHRTGL